MKKLRKALNFNASRKSPQHVNTKTSPSSFIRGNQQIYSGYDDHTIQESPFVNYTDPLGIDDTLSTKLHKWAFIGDLSKVRKFIKKIDVNSQDSYGRTALHLCSYAGHLEVLLDLLSSGAKAEIRDKDERTPLFKAAENSHLAVIQMLLQHQVDVNVEDRQENTPLHISASSGSKDVNKLFLEYGMNPEKTNVYGQKPIHIAAINLHVEVVKLFIARDVSVDVQDKQGVTPLMLVAKKGYKPLVEILLEAGADATLQDCSEWTASSYAKYAGFENIYKYLLDFIQENQRSFHELSSRSTDIGSNEDKRISEAAYVSPRVENHSRELSSENSDDSWDDDSNEVSSIKKIDMGKFFVGTEDSESLCERTSSHSPIEKSLSASVTSLGPPKPARSFPSSSSLVENISYKSSDQSSSRKQDDSPLECNSLVDEVTFSDGIGTALPPSNETSTSNESEKSINPKQESIILSNRSDELIKTESLGFENVDLTQSTYNEGSVTDDIIPNPKNTSDKTTPNKISDSVTYFSEQLVSEVIKTVTKDENLSENLQTEDQVPHVNLESEVQVSNNKYSLNSNEENDRDKVSLNGTLGRRDTLHDVEELWESNAKIRLSEESLSLSSSSSFGQNSSEAIKEMSGCTLKKRFFGDSKENCFDDSVKSKLECQTKSNKLLATEKKSFSDDNNSFVNLRQPDSNEFPSLTLYHSSDSEDENVVNLMEQKLPATKDTLENMIRKLRILLHKEQNKNLYYDSLIAEMKNNELEVINKLENTENISFDFQKATVEMASTIEQLEFMNRVSQNEASHSNLCFQEALEQLISLSQNRNNLQIIIQESKENIQALQERIDQTEMNSHKKNVPVLPEFKNQSTETDFPEKDHFTISDVEIQTVPLEDFKKVISEIKELKNQETFVTSELLGLKLSTTSSSTQTSLSSLNQIDSDVQTDLNYALPNRQLTNCGVQTDNLIASHSKESNTIISMDYFESSDDATNVKILNNKSSSVDNNDHNSSCTKEKMSDIGIDILRGESSKNLNLSNISWENVISLNDRPGGSKEININNEEGSLISDSVALNNLLLQLQSKDFSVNDVTELVTSLLRYLNNKGFIYNELPYNQKLLDEVHHHIATLPTIEKLAIDNSTSVSKLCQLHSSSSDQFLKEFKRQSSIAAENISSMGNNLNDIKSSIQAMTDVHFSKESKVEEIHSCTKELLQKITLHKSSLDGISMKENEITKKVQEIVSAIEQSTSESNEAINDSLKLLVQSLDETVSENFQIVQNFLQNLQSSVITKINEIKCDEEESRHSGIDMLHQQLENICSNMSQLKMAYEINNQNLSDGYFEPKVIEAIRGGNDQAICSIRLQNDKVLNVVEGYKDLLDQIANDQNQQQYNAIINDLRKEVKYYFSECKELKENNKLIEAKNIKLETEIASKLTELQAATVEINMMDKELKQLREENDNLRYEQSSNVYSNKKSRMDTVLQQVKNVESCVVDPPKHRIISNVSLSQQSNNSNQKIPLMQTNRQLPNFPEPLVITVKKSDLEQQTIEENDSLKKSVQSMIIKINEKERIISQLKDEISGLEAENNFLDSDLALKNSEIFQLQKGNLKQQKLIKSLQQTINETSNDTVTLEELKLQMSNFEKEISNKQKLIVNLQERMANIAKEKNILMDKLSHQQNDNLCVEMVLQEKEIALKTSEQLKSKLDSITGNLLEDYIPKTQLEYLYKDLEAYFESTYAMRKNQWEESAASKSRGLEERFKSFTEQLNDYKKKVILQKETIDKLQSNILISERNSQLWEVRYNELFESYHNASLPSLHQSTPFTKVSNQSTSINKSEFRNTLDEINQLIKTPYKESLFVNRSFGTPTSSIHLSSSSCQLNTSRSTNSS